MEKRQKNIGLPVERAIQLERLRVAIGADSLSRVFRGLIESARMAGLVTHDLPGVEVRRATDGLAVKFDGGTHEGLSFDQAADLARHLRAFSVGENLRTVEAVEGVYHVNNAGRGVQVSLGADSTCERIFARDVLLDLADLLDHAAKPVPA